MAASRGVSWCKDLCTSLCDITAAVSSLANINLPSRFLQAQIPHLQNLQRKLVSIVDPSQPPSHQSRTRMIAEHTLITSKFAAFLTAVVPLLDRLGAKLSSETASSVETPEKEGFWVLWSLLVDGCSVIQASLLKLPIAQPTENQPFYTQLFSALQSMLICLLRIWRSPAMMAMTPKQGLRVRKGELLTILALPTICLLDLSSSPQSFLHNHLPLLPLNLIPTLCCLVTEQFCRVPTGEPPAQPATGPKATAYSPHVHAFRTSQLCLIGFLNFLVTTINNLLANGYTERGLVHHCPILSTPPIVQFLKAVIIMPRETPCIMPNLVKFSITSLQTFLRMNEERSVVNSASRLSDSDWASRRDTCGLPLLLGPLLCGPDLNTDTRLLHALSQHMEEEDASMTTVIYSLKTLILHGWPSLEQLRSAPLGAPALMSSSVVGIARQVTRHALLIMRHLRQESQCASTQEVVVRSTGRQHQQQHQHAANLRGASLAALDASGFWELRSMIYQTSRMQGSSGAGGADMIPHVLHSNVELLIGSPVRKLQ